jgi:hypothetical protein
MAAVLAGARIGEHVACRRGQSKCVVKFAIAQLITNKPVTLIGGQDHGRGFGMNRRDHLCWRPPGQLAHTYERL